MQPLRASLPPLVLGAVALAAMAQEPAHAAPCVLAATSKARPTFTSGISDVPWHQKLGTYAGNEILVPLIFPYEVLSQAEIDYCNAPGGDPTRKLSQEDCMIEAGVGNILGYHRIDTLYDPTDDRKSRPVCTTQACTEVRLEVSNFRARSTGSGVALQPEVIGPFSAAAGLRRVLYHRRQHLRAADALGDVPLLRLDVRAGRHAGPRLLRRLFLADERRIPPVGDDGVKTIGPGRRRGRSFRQGAPPNPPTSASRGRRSA